MSSRFYTRYVPPGSVKAPSVSQAEKTAQFIAKLKKRKRAEQGDDSDSDKNKADKKQEKKTRKLQSTEELVDTGNDLMRKLKKGEENEIASQSTEKVKKKEKKDKKDKKDKKVKRKAKEVVENSREDRDSIQTEKHKERKKKKGIDADTDAEVEDAAKEDVDILVAGNVASKYSQKSDSDSDEKSAPIANPSLEPVTAIGHSLILEKLKKSLARAAAVAKATPAPVEEESIPQEEPVVPEGIQSLPQPVPAKESKRLSAFASLPSWLQEPITVSPTAKIPFSDIKGLSPKLQARLQSQGITDAFAVQYAVLPILLDLKKDEDMCISAATGSGKTLAYALPVVQSLLSRNITRLRAIIVVPTRELVQQVNTTAMSLIIGTGLKIGTASGAKALSVEQELLLTDEEGEMMSKVDILITTPGRLVEHVRCTPGFDLTHVKWLVIDEADRLLAQSFQEWVDIVIGGLEKIAENRRNIKTIGGMSLYEMGITLKRHHVRKVVLSATMSRDVGKLAELKLSKPSMVVVEDPPLPEDAVMDDTQGDSELVEQFSVPMGLREHVIPVENIEYKPLCLMYLLKNKDIKAGTLVFVKSNEGAARLAKLLEAVGEKSTNNKWNVGLVTGEMEKKRREKVLKRFAKSELDLLVCSDLISRGLDLPNVRHIINYDIPASTRAYIHRVGRTARAGKEGDAWTLLSHKEARWFWGNIGKGVRRSVALAKVHVEMEMEGYGLRGIYEGVLYGAE